MGDPIQPISAGRRARRRQAQPVLAQNLQADRPVCHCAYCRISSLFGPMMIITVGVFFWWRNTSR